MIFPRRVAPLLLALLLIAGPLAAAAHRPHEWQPRLSVVGLLSEAWDFVSRIWEHAGGSTFPLEKEGSSIDPFGNPKPTSQLPSNGTSKEGSSSDPFGNPKPTSQSGDGTTAANPSSGS